MSNPAPQRRTATATDDRRSSDRTTCVLEAAVSDAERAFVAATVLDLSACGVKLLVQPAPRPGEELRLTFLTADGRLFQVMATVVHYIEHGPKFAVGCRFARELEEAELDALL
jgi:hypothetical protein